ncbi:hypothetical protein N2599_28240 (plasmid) [Rhizobium sullae]|uniref:Uncharacterized protein n=1 Tax=Rhizobium sullae TaxID=50338 RepID=A0A2N0DC16_RHISU|nr:hypothetical protein [Rhizobium sullae]PKA43622.1 hypothetical protein CWR43_11805 [Rhizobium sullae]UWU16734.1 hypothetical protein N2599_28240 [Rhizobium sullae]
MSLQAISEEYKDEGRVAAWSGVLALSLTAFALISSEFMTLGAGGEIPLSTSAGSNRLVTL